VDREQLMDAMLDLTFEHGYEAVSVDMVAERAGGSRKDFSAIFSSKEACAIAVLEELTADNVRTVQGAYDRQDQWPDSLRAAAYAQADWILENPKCVRFGMVEMLWAGELTKAIRDNTFRHYSAMVDGGRAVADDPDSIPAFTADGAVGSITEMFAKRLQRGSVDDPYKFIPELMYLAVLPYLGEEAARRELTMPAPEQVAESGKGGRR
jgi:AcrR family transcriptional regulator